MTTARGRRAVRISCHYECADECSHVHCRPDCPRPETRHRGWIDAQRCASDCPRSGTSAALLALPILRELDGLDLLDSALAILPEDTLAEMNDPHVVALHYKIEHDSWVNYSRANPFDLHEDVFDLHVEDGFVTFTMKVHCGTEAEARSLVDDYARSWELHSTLAVGPGGFRLRFHHSDIEDRSPTPGVVSLRAQPITVTVELGNPELTVSPSGYPLPPAVRLGHDPDVEAMLRRYLRYREDPDRLAEVANFCLTVLMAAAGDRAAASQRYGIAISVLSRVGKLCDAKGGGGARKARGLQHPFSQNEMQFLDQVVRAMIRRAAEFAHDPNASFEQLTASEFPKT